MKNPIQPIEKDDNGILRFKANAAVCALYEWAGPRGFGLNELAVMDINKDDRQQFAQLLGYSLGGYVGLSYVDDDARNAAEKMSEGLSEDKARIKALQEELNIIRKTLQEPMARLFSVHPDDLGNNLDSDD